VLADNVTSSNDVRRCSDVTVANVSQLQQQLLQEVASRKAAELRANCLHKLLTELRNRKVSFSCFTLHTDYVTSQSALCHMFFPSYILNAVGKGATTGGSVGGGGGGGGGSGPPTFWRTPNF